MPLYRIFLARSSSSYPESDGTGVPEWARGGRAGGNDSILLPCLRNQLVFHVQKQQQQQQRRANMAYVPLVRTKRLRKKARPSLKVMAVIMPSPSKGWAILTPCHSCVPISG